MLFLVFILIFLAMLFVSLTVLVYARERMNPATQRLLRLNQPSREALLDRIIRQEKTVDERAKPIAKIKEKITVLISSLTTEGADSMSPEERIRYSKAGIRGANHLKVYMGIRTVLSAAVPSLYLLFALVSGHNILTIMLLGFCSFLAGRFLFELLIRNRIKSRNRLIGRNVHDAIDLLTICLEAGLGLNVALLKVGDNLKYINVALADEFLLLNHEIQAGSTRIEAYRNMRNRTEVRELRSLLTMLIQSETLGTSLGQVLRIYSDTLRTKIRQRAEERATKAGVKLAIPLVLFIFPPLFVVILGPALIQAVKLLRGFIQ